MSIRMLALRPWENKRFEGSVQKGDVIEVESESRARALESMRPHPLATRYEGKAGLGNQEAPSSASATARTKGEAVKETTSHSLSPAEKAPAAPISRRSFKRADMARED